MDENKESQLKKGHNIWSQDHFLFNLNSSNETKRDDQNIPVDWVDNTQQHGIKITADRLELALYEFESAVKSVSVDFIAYIAIFITLLSTIFGSTFNDAFGLSGVTIKNIFVFVFFLLLMIFCSKVFKFLNNIHKAKISLVIFKAETDRRKWPDYSPYNPNEKYWSIIKWYFLK